MKISYPVIVILCLSLFFLGISVGVNSYACTGIRLQTEDGNYIFARTLEFGADFIWHTVIAVPRGYNYVGYTPTGKPGMAWQAKYAYVGFAPLGLPVVDDGLNEKGLACGGFFLPGYAKYEDVTEKDYPRAIGNVDVVAWILSNCADVNDVRRKLPEVYVCPVAPPQLGYVAPLHFFVADRSGDAVVIEYLEGKLNIYENEVNVITNSPAYPWHLQNLRNYIALKPENQPAITINGYEFAQFGQGSGAIGLPGDFSPPSRFVRAQFFANSAFRGQDVDEGVRIAFHILNQFDIPKGSMRGMEAGKPVNDTTQWTSAADLTNTRYFYHTYNDRSVRMIDLKNLDLNAPGIKSIQDIEKEGEFKDVTGQLK